ncbi:MAG: glutamine synthetase [Deltaproteobacteria bacterium]|nr:glutamine synthetase [Deltaproteobacteria bacterium]MBW1955247.1 glutamine synthetase [Deltaproteobacteria bacterium]MBW2041807.1 glutamine synthetase [Deltaproteobacteria bacterium]MBW2132428.1 glutamine synthetase [Deltaproteobacteria bacterium]
MILKTQLKDIDVAKIFFTDINGRIMSLSFNPQRIESILENGIGFDGSSIAGYARVENSDRLLFPDPSSFKKIPFSDGTVGFFTGKIYNAPEIRSPADPRAVLEKVLNEAEADHGYRFTIGPEHEFFLLSKESREAPVHSDAAGYFQSAPHDKGEPVRRRIVDTLKRCGIEFEKTHHEVTSSQHEINLEPAAPLWAADRTVLVNHVIHTIASEMGFYASFMPKPFDHFNRNAFHVHLSMQDRQGKNLFYEKGAPFDLSPLARRFIGGILEYAREASIVMASTNNSYKAYVIEREAPVVRGWGYANRSSMVRIPRCEAPQSTRIELRNPDPAGNVYLQLAVLIAMGIRGIKEKRDCGKPDTGSTYKKAYQQRVYNRRFLPRSLFEALMEAERSRFLKEVLGERVFENYLAVKIREWELHRTGVTPLEHRMYLNV